MSRPAAPRAGLRILAVASEVFPLVKTGGLADVAGALPGALAAEGVAMRTLLPAYPKALAALEAPTVEHDKAKPPQCADCRFDARCGGVWRRYLEARGSDEIVPVRA